MSWMIVVQWLHVIAGVIWAGTQAGFTLAVLPALARRPPPEAKAALGAIGPRIGPLMAGTGMTLMVLGVLRGTVFGPIRSWHVLFGSPYGHTFLAALVLMGIMIAHGASSPRRIPKRLWDGDTVLPGAERFLRQEAAVTMTLIAAVIACMVLMRFGL